ncbi:MAG: DNA polymerase III subunit beta [Alphaproteobacteria bacterium]|nr:DNA polymerase III subunit beta [Alphaproteobacteria bacterium]
MRFTVEKAALLKPLSHAQGVVERRNTIPILSNVLMSVKDGQLNLTATDMDIDVAETLPVDMAQEGSATAPAHTFHDIVRKLPDGAEVEVSAEGGSRITVKAGRSSFQLAALPTDEFPVLDGDDLTYNFTLQPDALRAIIDRTRFAISTEETRYYLNGIYMHATDSDVDPMLRAVATDGHRLARFEMALPEGAKGMPGVIVPRKAVNEVRKLIDDVDDEIEISLSETKMRFAFGHIRLTTKLIDGTFPDYERVIPQGNDKRLSLDCKSFAQAVDRVATISTEKSRAVKLALEPGLLTLSASSPDAGMATEEVEVGYDAGQMEIGFNSKYLLDIAQQIEGDQVEFVLADAASPTVVLDAGDSGALYVLMPMRV